MGFISDKLTTKQLEIGYRRLWTLRIINQSAAESTEGKDKIEKRENGSYSGNSLEQGQVAEN